ncbi:MAG TPA: DNA cytosine methyltransferase [Caulobacteraceae bacterium]|nr:DNA cytosine methyltransferase [Caulobacteraceae bacterium]
MRALSLFSGIGGLCEGVKLAGFEIAGAAEWDKFAAHNYRLNFPAIPLFEGDVAELLPDDGEESARQHDEFVGDGIDLIFGGPPCQGFSQIGPRDPADPRNELYLHMTRLATRLKPRYVLIENVPNMLLMKRGMFRDRILRALNEAGYDNAGVVVWNAAEFGVPQARKRVFILATPSAELDVPVQDILDATGRSLQAPEVTVEEAIKDLPDRVVHDGETLPYPSEDAPSAFQLEMRLGEDGQRYGHAHKQRHYDAIRESVALHNHHTKEIQSRRLALIELLKPGAKANSLPKHVWDNARPEKWRRLAGDKPAHTLMAQMHRDLSEWVHPRLHRWITVREALRLQSFHDGFVLETSEWQMLKQIGNAVPPLLGYVPAMAVRYAESIRTGTKAPFSVRGQLSLFQAAS